MGVQKLIPKLKFMITILKMIHTCVYYKRWNQNLRRKEEKGKKFELTKGEKMVTAARKENAEISTPKDL